MDAQCNMQVLYYRNLYLKPVGPLLTYVTQINLIIKKKKILDAVTIPHNREKKNLFSEGQNSEGTAGTKLGNLNAEGVIQSLSCRGQGGHSTTKVKVAMVAVKESRVKNSLTCADLWHWLIDQDVPRSEIDRKLTKFLFDL